MTQSDFPRHTDAPAELRLLPGSCGPVSAWQTLTHFGRKVTPADLLADCRFDPAVGAYTIGLAVAFARRALRVDFYSDADRDYAEAEQALFSEAHELGIGWHSGQSLYALDAAIQETGTGIILYETAVEAHFTPFLGLYDDEVIAPNEGDGLKIDDIEARRSAPGILRQSIVVRRM